MGEEQPVFANQEFEAFALAALGQTVWSPRGIYAVTPGKALAPRLAPETAGNAEVVGNAGDRRAAAKLIRSSWDDHDCHGIVRTHPRADPCAR